MRSEARQAEGIKGCIDQRSVSRQRGKMGGTVYGCLAILKVPYPSSAEPASVLTGLPSGVR
jgi:hypothetical protein